MIRHAYLTGEERTLVRSALMFARRAHAGQTRKDGRTPYLFHPVRVCNILATELMPGPVLAAAMLHDTIEDCDVRAGQLQAVVGIEVTRMVQEVTDQQGSSAARKLAQLENAPFLTRGAAAIKLADKTANLIDMVERPPVGYTLEDRTRYAWHAEALAGAVCWPLWGLRAQLFAAARRAKAPA